MFWRIFHNFIPKWSSSVVCAPSWIHRQVINVQPLPAFSFLSLRRARKATGDLTLAGSETQMTKLCSWLAARSLALYYKFGLIGLIRDPPPLQIKKRT
jgi:hypothetical protein